MKNILVLILVSTCLASHAQPALLSKGDGVVFSYMECLNNLPKKSDRYCSRYDYIYKFEKDTLYVTEIWNYKVDIEKKAVAHYTFYKAYVKQLSLLDAILAIPNIREVEKIKNMEGGRQYMYPFEIKATHENAIKQRKMLRGAYVETNINSLRLYADSKKDIKDLLNFLFAKQD